MNPGPLIIDGITELLVNIIEFTNIRQKVLHQNINNVHVCGYVPQELPVDEFSELLDNAIDEYIQNRHLPLCDSSNIKFGGGGLYVEPISDRAALSLLEEDRDKYLESQIDKLMENSLNQRLAAELLRQKVEKDLSLQVTTN
jgi:flagellar basal body rod protein FlgB